jgi:hypothetical protein
MNINVVAKRRDGEWRGATVKDGVFQNAQVDSDMVAVLSDAFTILLSENFADGADLSVTIVASNPVQVNEG